MFGDIALITNEFLTFSKELKLSFFILPNIKKLIETIIKIEQTIISILEFLKINIAGNKNREMQIKLKE